MEEKNDGVLRKHSKLFDIIINFNKLVNWLNIRNNSLKRIL